MWILNLQEIKPETITKSLNMLFNNNGHRWIITNSIAIFWALTVFEVCRSSPIIFGQLVQSVSGL
jgi:hypothetical protein